MCVIPVEDTSLLLSPCAPAIPTPTWKHARNAALGAQEGIVGNHLEVSSATVLGNWTDCSPTCLAKHVHIVDNII